MTGFEGLLRETMLLAAMLCVPVLAVAAFVGAAVAVAQAATQVQEQTLTLLPKVIAVAATVVLFGGFAMHACAQLFHDAVAAIPAMLAQ
ncbi:MAG TPA: flagellar biosynthetic protein FliQ [Candidatus Baltobacteraceae bacterium]|nr:flagellar biosynthetic protein FliQ [Candidatus Baltobacteraceae bacterium]